jgi:hypothetical protein
MTGGPNMDNLAELAYTNKKPLPAPLISTNRIRRTFT